MISDPLLALARPSRWNPRVRLPRVERLPNIVPVLAGLTLLATAALKAFEPNYLCGGARPFGVVNALMLPVELVCGYALLREGSARRLAALVTCAVMIGAAIYLTRAELAGVSTRGCGCFGPIELPYAGHLAVIAALIALCVPTFLREDVRLSSPA